MKRLREDVAILTKNKKTPPAILEWNDGVLEPARFLYLRQQPGHHAPLSLADFTYMMGENKPLPQISKTKKTRLNEFFS